MATTLLRRSATIAMIALTFTARPARAQQPVDVVPPYSVDLTAGKAIVGLRDGGRAGLMLALGSEVALDDNFAVRAQVEAGTVAIVSAGFKFRGRRRHPDGRSWNEMGFAGVHAPEGWRPAFYLGLGSDVLRRSRAGAFTLRGRIYAGAHNAGLSLNIGYKWLWR